MDVSNVFTEKGNEIEEYKVYMYTMFAKEVARNVRRYINGKVFVMPDPANDTLIVSVSGNLTGVINGVINYASVVPDILSLMKADDARGASKAIVKDYKNNVWHAICKGGRPMRVTEDATNGQIEVNTYDDDVKRLYFNEHMSVEQISDALQLHADAVNKTLEGLID